MKTLLLPIIIPLVGACVVALSRRTGRIFKETVTIVTALLNLAVVISLFKQTGQYVLPWLGSGIEFNLRLYQFSAFIIAAVAVFGFLIALYCSSFLQQKPYAKQFYAYLLLTISFVNGAVLSDNLIVLLFFWEGLLLTLFAMIYIGKKEAFKTAIKAFVIVGITDVCMMVGIALTGHLAKTLTISQIHLAPGGGLASLAFILLMIGAIAKAGSMPFHTWIPDAAVDAPLPFMALMPAALEKLLGIYFLTRISMDMFSLVPQSSLSTLMMTIGALTIILAVMMALIQKDYKRLLSYHAISQVGYMILGVGTCLPVGIVGGLFHMINNCLYKSCLFLTAGSVEHKTGTTDLTKLGGLGKFMPVTWGCFIIASLSISGVPPFNGFFSKELIYDAALSRGFIFYLAAAGGSLFTALSFLKLGHAAFLGKANPEHKKVEEVSWPMAIPMIVIALSCILFGVWNALPIHGLIQPVLGEAARATAQGHHLAGFPENMLLVVITVVVLLIAVSTHIWQAKLKGSGLEAADYIHHAPVLSQVYNLAEKRFFDPYEIGLKFTGGLCTLLHFFDRLMTWVYDVASVRFALKSSQAVRGLHNGNYSTYLGWSLAGVFLAVVFLLTRG